VAQQRILQYPTHVACACLQVCSRASQEVCLHDLEVILRDLEGPARKFSQVILPVNESSPKPSRAKCQESSRQSSRRERNNALTSSFVQLAQRWWPVDRTKKREGGVTSGAYAGPRAYGTYAGSCARFASGAGHRQGRGGKGHGGGKNRVSED
jgi:hypothetical protein